MILSREEEAAYQRRKQEFVGDLNRNINEVHRRGLARFEAIKALDKQVARGISCKISSSCRSSFESALRSIPEGVLVNKGEVVSEQHLGRRLWDTVSHCGCPNLSMGGVVHRQIVMLKCSVARDICDKLADLGVGEVAFYKGISTAWNLNGLVLVNTQSIAEIRRIGIPKNFQRILRELGIVFKLDYESTFRPLIEEVRVDDPEQTRRLMEEGRAVSMSGP